MTFTWTPFTFHTIPTEERLRHHITQWAPLLHVCTLTLIAGQLNAIALSSLFDTAVSHQTGLFAKSGASLAAILIRSAKGTNEVATVDNVDAMTVFVLATVMICAFTLGAVIAGTFGLLQGDGRNKQRMWRPITVSIIYFIMVWLSYIATFTLDGADLGQCSLIFIGIACGIQNGMSTLLTNGLARTTHITGTLTCTATTIGELISFSILWSIWKLKSKYKSNQTQNQDNSSELGQFTTSSGQSPVNEKSVSVVSAALTLHAVDRRPRLPIAHRNSPYLMDVQSHEMARRDTSQMSLYQTATPRINLAQQQPSTSVNSAPRLPDSLWKLKLLVPLLLSFWIGIIIGAVLFTLIGIHSLSLPAGMVTLITAITLIDILRFR